MLCRVGEVKSLHYWSTDLVLWRDDAGEYHLQDAFCPHLGAHLGCAPQAPVGALALFAQFDQRGELGRVIVEQLLEFSPRSRRQRCRALDGAGKRTDREPRGL